jgi:hypothetical protein
VSTLTLTVVVEDDTVAVGVRDSVGASEVASVVGVSEIEGVGVLLGAKVAVLAVVGTISSIASTVSATEVAITLSFVSSVEATDVSIIASDVEKIAVAFSSSFASKVDSTDVAIDVAVVASGDSVGDVSSPRLHAERASRMILMISKFFFFIERLPFVLMVKVICYDDIDIHEKQVLHENNQKPLSF